ncbi:MAG: hypothetical protein IH596_02990 [Bacteroidales bacterium]|nr:hypothetical protein [Bacteroidales bacterium]
MKVARMVLRGGRGSNAPDLPDEKTKNFAAMDFNSGIPVPILTSAMLANVRVSISVADSIGSLLFYGDYEKIWNRNNQPMPNGTGLLGGSSIGQAILAIPKLGEDSCYYIFTVGNGSFNPPYYGLYYSVLDMRLNGGLGDIRPFAKNIPIPTANDACEHITSIRHHNNQDIWVVMTKENSYQNAFASYLVTSSGISPTPVLSPSFLLTLGAGGGQMKISPDGSKLVICQGDSVEVCNFNSNTGAVIPLFTFIPQQGTPYPNKPPHGVEFSINSKYLYISNNDYNPDTTGGSLYQYDVTKTDSLQFLQSEFLLGYGAYLYLQMGPDGKIYVPPHDLTGPGMTNQNLYFHVIENPSVYGDGCGYHKNAVYLGGGGRKAIGSVPQFLQKYYAYIHHAGQCQGSPVFFNCVVWPQVDSVWWNFGDPGSGQANFSNRLSPSHIYSLPGNYTVSFIVRHIDMRYDTVIRQIEILPAYIPSIGDDKIICNGDSVTFDAGSCFGCSYLWKNAITGLPVGNSQTYTTIQAGTYLVMVTSPNGCVCTDTVQLATTPAPQISNNIISDTICSGESTNIHLTSNITGTLFHWLPTLTTGNITGFIPDSGLVISQMLTNHIATAGLVTYSVTPKVGSCTGSPVNFTVTVNPGDSSKVVIDASVNNICEGTLVTFTTTPTNPGTNPNYQWKVNGIDSGGNIQTFMYSPLNGDLVNCTMTSSIPTCISNNPATSNTIIMIVNPNLPVGVTVSPTANDVCAGTLVTFIANPTYPGNISTYHWKVNGLIVGTNSPTYSFIPLNNDVVTCTLTSSETCTQGNPATSIPIAMIVIPLLPVGISISASNNPVCEGLPVTFTATPVNGGVMPAYQWQVNGINVGTNNPDFTYIPVDGDLVSCTLTSNAECITNNPATSNFITMSVGEAPDVSFLVCFDSITTLNAKPFKLKGGVPLGGTYSGNGTSWTSETGWTFNPSIAGTGLHSVTYSYTNLFNCSNNATRAITVINPVPLSCGDSLTDIRDNKKYSTVQIGSQCWLAANLNYGVQISGSQSQRDNCIPEKYCYNDIPELCALRSALYQWDELMRYEDTEEIQGLCPPGWHVPSEADWAQLFAVYQGNAFAGSPLLYTGYSGFNVLLAGVEFFNQNHRFTDFASIMWSSTSHGPYKAWSHGLNEFNYSVSYYPSYRANAFSVRCLRD